MYIATGGRVMNVRGVTNMGCSSSSAQRYSTVTVSPIYVTTLINLRRKIRSGSDMPRVASIQGIEAIDYDHLSRRLVDSSLADNASLGSGNMRPA
jgi:hypothetical protein